MFGWHSRHRHHHHGRRGGHGGWGGNFGVRRPLRYLAYKLELEDDQVAELAKILKDLKTERAQAEVDNERALSALADAVGEAKLDDKALSEALDGRVDSARKVQDAVLVAVRKIHALLEDEQRERLAYLLRTGSLTM